MNTKINEGSIKPIYAARLKYTGRPIGIGLRQIANIKKAQNLPSMPAHMAGFSGFTLNQPVR